MMSIQSWLSGMSLSAKLTATYTMIVMLVAGVLSVTLYVQLRESQRGVARERVQDIVNLAIRQIDGDFHTLIVSPKDAESAYYRIIQTELQNIQATSTAITRITTLREQGDGDIMVVVDHLPTGETATSIGQPAEVTPPVLESGLGTIAQTVVEEAPITLPSGTVRFYGYAPIVDQSGRQDGVLAIELDASPLLASEIQARNTALLAFFLTLPLVLLAGIWMVRKATAPVGELLRGAERITHGQLDYRVPVHNGDELGMLAATFNTMTDSLQARIAAEQQTQQELTYSHQQLQEYNASLEQAMHEQQRLSETVRQLSLPVLPIADHVIVLPLIGTIDSRRAHELSEVLLKGVEQHRAQVVLIDLTGVPAVDTLVAQILVRAMTAIRLLGARTLLVGIRPELAQALIQIGADLSDITTAATLQSGLLRALSLTGGWSRTTSR